MAALRHRDSGRASGRPAERATGRDVARAGVSWRALGAACAALLLAATWQDAAPPPRAAVPLVDSVLELAPLEWWLDGRPLDLGEDGQPKSVQGSVSLDGPVITSLPVAPRAEGDAVELSFYSVGGSWPRWSTVFETPTGEAGMARLDLEWEGGPDGALFEVVLDGRRLSPPRDAWRPTTRPLRSDLGPAWLGPGRHLLEFVLRERSVPSTLRLRRLHVEHL